MGDYSPDYLGLQHALLSPEEELALAKRLPARRARDELVRRNMRLVATLAQRVRNRGSLAFEDLLQCGALGLMRAAETFDWRRGFRFSTYAMWWVRHALERAVADTAQIVRVSVHAREQGRRVSRARTRIQAATGREATAEELQAMGVSGKSLARADALPRSPHSLDAPFLEESDAGTLHEVLPSPNAGPEATLLAAERAQEASALLESLPPRLRGVLAARTGDAEATLAEVGEGLGVSRERVRQLEVEALGRVRQLAARRKVSRELRQAAP